MRKSRVAAPVSRPDARKVQNVAAEFQNGTVGRVYTRLITYISPRPTRAASQRTQTRRVTSQASVAAPSRPTNQISRLSQDVPALVMV